MNTISNSKIERLFLIVLVLFVSINIKAQTIEYEPEDSIRIVNILKKASTGIGTENAMLYFGKQFLGVPYVAYTLENGNNEHLIVNTRELDCTTFVETICALSICHNKGITSFDGYCNVLKQIRYRNGELKDYTSRLHYFTWWGEDNEKMGMVKCISRNEFPFTATQTININYMSTHPTLYKQLKNHKEFVPIIAQLEQNSKGKHYRYIPKSLFNCSPEELDCIHTGDILAIITSKSGLDTSHIGIAVWQGNALHLMHASSLYKKVVIDSNSFYNYSQKQTSQLGIRLFRLNE